MHWLAAGVLFDLKRIFTPLPLVDEFFDDVLGRKVQVNFPGGQVVVAEEPLQRRQRDPLLHGRDGERVSENMR